jgi:2,3-dihydro-2,3-dihydroxybenzoate dehydrogenase
MDRMGLEGKVVLVTGAAQGIGEAVARAVTAHGARAAILDANESALKAVAADLTAAGHDAAAYPADVRDNAAVEEAIDQAERDMGPIDVLVNVAGVLSTGAIMELTDEDWRTTFAVNTDGVFHVSRAATRRMAARGSGTVVTVGSNAAGVPRIHMGAYAASKAAAVMFTKCLGLELAEYGIRCNVVSPGSTETPMQWSLWTDDHGARSVIEGSPAAFKVGIPLRKLARPVDVAESVVFLASDLAGHITMQDLYVDGGAALGI